MVGRAVLFIIGCRLIGELKSIIYVSSLNLMDVSNGAKKTLQD